MSAPNRASAPFILDLTGRKTTSRQAKLSFAPITVDQWREQTAETWDQASDRICRKIVRDVVSKVVTANTPKPRVGRPVGSGKKAYTVNLVPDGAAAADLTPQQAAADGPGGSGAADQTQDKKKREVKDWRGPHMRTIHAAVIATAKPGGLADFDAARKHLIAGYSTVANFSDLAITTMYGWYEKDDLGQYTTKLTEASKKAYDRKRTWAAGPGQVPVLEKIDPAVRQQMADAVRNNRKAGIPMNSIVVRGLLIGVLLATAAYVLDPVISGGLGLTMCRSWVRKYCNVELNMTFRRQITAAQKLPANYEQQILCAKQRVAYLVQEHNIPEDLVINFDQTALYAVPTAGACTYEVQGSKEVPVVNADDKRCITAVIASTLSGMLLPLQLIFQGKTAVVHPVMSAAARAAGHHITHSENHWSSQQTMRELVQHVIVPFVTSTVEKLGLDASQHAIILLDCWSVHISEEFRTYMRENHPNLHLVYIPGGTTGIFQPADVALNRPFKHFMRNAFMMWAANQVAEQIRALQQLNPGQVVDMSTVKIDNAIGPLRNALMQHAHEAYEYVASKANLVRKGWEKCGLDVVSDPAFQLEAVRQQAREPGSLFRDATALVDNPSGAVEVDAPASDAVIDDPAVSTDRVVEAVQAQEPRPRRQAAAHMYAPGHFDVVQNGGQLVDADGFEDELEAPEIDV